MVWIVIISVLQGADGSYSIDRTQVRTVAPDVAAEMTKQCDARPDCVEPRPGFYILDMTPPAAPPVRAPDPPAKAPRRAAPVATARRDQA